MIDSRPLRERFAVLSPHLSERERPFLAAYEARAAGYGCIASTTIGRGLKELAAPEKLDPDRVRRPGGAVASRWWQDATLLADLLAVVAPDARGDPSLVG